MMTPVAVDHTTEARCRGGGKLLVDIAGGGVLIEGSAFAAKCFEMGDDRFLDPIAAKLRDKAGERLAGENPLDRRDAPERGISRLGRRFRHGARIVAAGT